MNEHDSGGKVAEKMMEKSLKKKRQRGKRRYDENRAAIQRLPTRKPRSDRVVIFAEDALSECQGLKQEMHASSHQNITVVREKSGR